MYAYVLAQIDVVCCRKPHYRIPSFAVSYKCSCFLLSFVLGLSGGRTCRPRLRRTPQKAICWSMDSFIARRLLLHTSESIIIQVWFHFVLNPIAEGVDRV